MVGRGGRSKARCREAPVVVRATVALSGAVLLVPSVNYQLFSGLPLSTLPELIGLILWMPLLLSRALRQLSRKLVERMGWLGRRALLGVVLLALGGKLLLLVSGTYGGFLACYSSPISWPPPAPPCERSYENPFFRFASTRIDRVIRFSPDTWDLSFFNSSRFNFYPWISGTVLRERLPFSMVWRGAVERSRPWEAQVTYVG